MSARPVHLGLAALLVATPAAAQGTRYTVAGRDVAIYNLAGMLRVEPGTGGSVVVEVTRHGADASRLDVQTGTIEGRETLRVIYPDDRIVYEPLGRHSRTQISVREDGTFNGHGGRHVTISGDGSGLEASADLRVLVPEGQRITVNLAVGHVAVTNVNAQLMVDASSADVEASGTRGSLSIDVGSGDVQVSRAEGNLSVDTGSGNVTLADVKAEDVGIDTGSGDVAATTLGARSLKIDTGSGGVKLAGVATENADLDTGSGDIEIDVDASLKSFHAETGSGNVTLRAPASLSASLDIETSSGEIDSDFDVAVTRREDDHLVGRIGSGAGRISVDTGSGDVRLVRR
jgi:lia operon protein LiaG